MIDNHTLDDSTTTLATLSDDVRHVTTLLQLDADDKQRDSINAVCKTVLLQVADIIDNETARLKKLID